MDVAGAVAGCAHDDRVDEPHQRRIRHSVVDLEIVLVLDDLELVEHRLGLGHLGLLGETLELVGDVLAVGDEELDRVPRGDLELVDAEDVRRVGDRDLELLAVERHGYRDNAAQGAKRDQLGRTHWDPGVRELEVGQSVTACERPRDPRSLCGAFVVQRLGERPCSGAPTGRGKPIAGDEIGELDELGDEIGDRLVAALLLAVAVLELAEVGRRAQRRRGLELHDALASPVSGGSPGTSPGSARRRRERRWLPARGTVQTEAPSCAPASRAGAPGSGRDEREQQAQHQPDGDVPAEHGAEQERQLDVAHAHPLRIGEGGGEEEPGRGDSSSAHSGLGSIAVVRRARRRSSAARSCSGRCDARCRSRRARPDTEQKNEATAASGVRPKRSTQATIRSAVSARQPGSGRGSQPCSSRHRPRSSAYDSSGMLSHAAYLVLQLMHADRSRTRPDAPGRVTRQH